MKKTGLLITKVLMLIGLISLWLFQETSFAGNTNTSGKIQVVTSLPILKNITEKIGGDKLTVESIVQGPKCDHEYEPRPSDMKKLAKSAVFIKIGMGSDPWADKLAAGTLNKKAIFIDASKGVKIMEVRGLKNPHYWGSPENVKISANNILMGLCSVVPKQQAYFESNYQKFAQEIDKTTVELKAKVATLKNKKLVSYAGAFPYFFQYFGFENLMTVELFCEQEVSPKDIADAAKLMKTQQITILIGGAGEPNEPDGLAKETNAKKILLWETTDDSNDYLTTLRHNVEIMVSALK
jgi:ABC-type Zn uptake system ZnuABC Zn-binding protein ZnuA